MLAETESASEEDEEFSDEWISNFCDTEGNELFCEVDKDFIKDNFNLFGIKAFFPSFYSESLNVILDVAEYDDAVESAAKHLYYHVHARYIMTAAGLQRMKSKFISGEFGVCPRMLCDYQSVVPMGRSDEPRVGSVKLYCPKCRDVYSCSVFHSHIDGCAFGTSFAHLFFMTFPDLDPGHVRAEKGKLSAPPLPSKYIPRIYGFRVHQPYMFAQRQVQLHGGKPQPPPPPPATLLGQSGQPTIPSGHTLSAPAAAAVVTEKPVEQSNPAMEGVQLDESSSSSSSKKRRSGEVDVEADTSMSMAVNPSAGDRITPQTALPLHSGGNGVTGNLF